MRSHAYPVNCDSICVCLCWSCQIIFSRDSFTLKCLARVSPAHIYVCVRARIKGRTFTLIQFLHILITLPAAALCCIRQCIGIIFVVVVYSALI